MITTEAANNVEVIKKAPTRIPVSEIFGPTLEGEGPWAGQPTYFLRIGGCDYACAWCDTDQAVLAENVRKLPRLTTEEIWQKLFAYTKDHPGPDLLAISGGNPGLYDLSEIVHWWQGQDRSANHHDTGQKKVLVETQGSKWQPWFADVDLLTVSPKAPSSGLDKTKSLNALDAFVGAHSLSFAASVWRATQMILKIVVFDEEDYQFARFIHVRYPEYKLHLSTGTAMGGLDGRWVPPVVSHRAQRMMTGDLLNIDTKLSLLARYRWLAERAMNDPAMADAQVQVQLHCLLWGITTKGV